jgi:hypothetical protein
MRTVARPLFCTLSGFGMSQILPHEMEQAVPEISGELPDALPERGVLVLQLYPGWIDIYNTARARFLENVMNIYNARGTPATDKYCFDHPGHSLNQDEELLKRISEEAQDRPVLVHFKVQGEPEDHEPRLRELEQQLVHFLTKDGLVVSLIRARHPTRAQALLHRPMPDGELSKVKVDFDLKPYLENSVTREQEGQT